RAELAGKRATVAKAEAGTLEARLRDLADATPEANAALVSRVDRLGALVEQLDAATPRLAALDDEAERARADAARLAGEASLLGGIRVPADLADLHDRLATAAAVVDRTAAGLSQAEMATASTEAALAALADRAELVRWLDAHERAAGLRERRVKAEAVVTERRADLAAAAEAVAAAQHAVAAARASEDA